MQVTRALPSYVLVAILLFAAGGDAFGQEGSGSYQNRFQAIPDSAAGRSFLGGATVVTGDVDGAPARAQKPRVLSGKQRKQGIHLLVPAIQGGSYAGSPPAPPKKPKTARDDCMSCAD